MYIYIYIYIHIHKLICIYIYIFCRIPIQELARHGLRGEGITDERVWLVKSHWPERRGVRPVGVSAALVLVRSPFDAIDSYFNLVLTGAQRYTCRHIFTQTHTHTHICLHTHTHTHTHICVCVYVCIYDMICISIFICTSIYVYTHTHYAHTIYI